MTRWLAGTISSASATVAPSVSAQPQDLSVRSVPPGQQVHGVRRRARRTGSCRGCPPPATTRRRGPGVAGRSATRHRHPSAPGPSATGRRRTRTGQFSAMTSSATPSGKSSRSAGAAEVAEPHLLPEAGGIGHEGVPEPGAVVAPGHRAAHQVDVRDRLRRRPRRSRRRRRAASRPRSRAPTARRRAGCRPATGRTSRSWSRPTDRWPPGPRRCARSGCRRGR